MAPVPETTLRTYLTSLLSRSPSPSPTPTTTFPSLLTRALHQLEARATLVNPGSGVTDPSSIPNKVVFIFFGLIGVGFVCTGIWFFFFAKNGGFYFKQNDWDDYKSTVLRRKGPNGTTLSGATESTNLGGGSVVHGEGKSRGGRSIWGRKKKEKRYRDKLDYEDGMTVDGSELTGTTIDGTEIDGGEHKKLKKERRWRRNKKAKEQDMTEVSTEIGTVEEQDEEMDVGLGHGHVHETIRAYRHEKPARVGGINKLPDASVWEGSTNDASTSAGSDLLSHREPTPTNTPKKERRERGERAAGGIRKVNTVSVPNPSSISYTHSRDESDVTETTKMLEENPIKVEARRLQEKGRAATSQNHSARRDFSFRVGDDGSSVGGPSAAEVERRERRERRKSRSPSKRSVPGGFYDAVSEIGEGTESLVSGLSGGTDETGTKSYHHPIPGLALAAPAPSGGGNGGTDYAEERRRKRKEGGGGAYRRGRGGDE